MERTLPSPAWASNVYFNSHWTNSLSLSSLFVRRFCTKIMDFMCQHHEPFSRYIGRNFGKYLWENTLQLRSWGSDVEVSAAATLLQTTIVIYTALTETIRRWLSYKPLFPVAGTTKARKRFTWEIFVSTLNVCADSSLKSVPGWKNSSQHKLPGHFFFNQ